MTKLSAEQRIQKAHVALMNDPKYCLYSGVLMLGQTSVEDDVPTAYTDGRNTRYGRKFVDGLSDPELRGLILHENMHKAFRHLTTWDNLYTDNATLANVACDYVINLMIKDSDKEGKFVTLPEGGCYDEQYRGLDAGTVYRMLKKKYSNKGKGKGDGEESSGNGDGPPQGFDEHDWEGAKEMSREEKETLAKDIDQALRQGAILAGKMGANLPREVSDALESKVDWREALRDFISSTCADKDVSTWRKPNRRWVDQDVYLPSLVGESVGRLVVAIDMSGSIGANEIGQFLGEVRKICNTVTPEGIDLIYWDTEVCAHEKYERDELDSLLTSTKPAGGGGTCPQCISDYIRDNRLKPEAIVVLTDGYVDGWGNGWTAPLLWGITTKGKTPSVGVGVTIE